MSDFGTAVVGSDPLAPWPSPLARAMPRNRSKPRSRYVRIMVGVRSPAPLPEPGEETAPLTLVTRIE